MALPVGTSAPTSSMSKLPSMSGKSSNASKRKRGKTQAVLVCPICGQSSEEPAVDSTTCCSVLFSTLMDSRVGSPGSRG